MTGIIGGKSRPETLNPKVTGFHSQTDFLNLVEYEIAGSWWICYISNTWLQSAIAKYIVWKTKRKFNRLQRHYRSKGIYHD